MIDITIGGFAGAGTPLKDWLPLFAGFLAFVGVLLTIAYTGKRQRESFDNAAKLQRDAVQQETEAETKLREEVRAGEIRVVRALVFAQLARVYRTIQEEYGYFSVEENNFTWIPVYISLLPTLDALKRIELLAPQEVVEVTSFYYSYHENMGYIASVGDRSDLTAIKLDCHVLGVNYGQGERLRWLVDALGTIEEKAKIAMDAVLAGAEADVSGGAELAARLEAEQVRNAERATEGLRSLKMLAVRIRR